MQGEVQNTHSHAVLRNCKFNTKKYYIVIKCNFCLTEAELKRCDVCMPYIVDR